MPEKIIEHGVYEECKISKKKINTEKDDYAIIVDCTGNKIEGFGFYKRDLLRDLLVGNLELVKADVKKRTTDDIMNMAQGMLGRMGLNLR